MPTKNCVCQAGELYSSFTFFGPTFQINFSMEAEVARQTSTVLLCDVCEDGATAAEVACTDCQKRLCSTCRRVHDQIAAVSTHIFVGLALDGQRELAKPASSGINRKHLCTIHGQEAALFCDRCDVTLCHQCQSASHEGHVTEKLTEVVERLRKEVRSLLQDVQQRVKAEDKVMEQSNKEEQELERQKQEVVGQVVEAAGKVTAWAKEAEDKVVAQINDVSAPTKSKLLALKNAALERKTALDQLRNRARLITQSGSLAELKSLRQQMKETLSTVAESTSPKSGENGSKEMEFFKRESSGQQLLQNVVTRFVGEVSQGEDKTPDRAKSAASFSNGFQFKDNSFICLFSFGEKMLSLSISKTKSKHRGAGDRTTLTRIMQLNEYDFPGNQKSEEIQSTLRYPSGIVSIVSISSSAILFSAGGTLFIGPDLHNLVRVNDVRQRRNEILLAHSFFNDSRVYGLTCCNYSHVFEIIEITLSTPKSVNTRAFFQIVHGSPEPAIAFAVSSDEEYFAVLRYSSKSSVTVSVYRRKQPYPTAVFNIHEVSLQQPSYGTNVGDLRDGDVCFSMFNGKEMLRVASRGNNTVYVLDHLKDCRVVGRMDITEPTYMATDAKGRVWIRCRNEIVAFSPWLHCGFIPRHQQQRERCSRLAVCGHRLQYCCLWASAPRRLSLDIGSKMVASVWASAPRLLSLVIGSKMVLFRHRHQDGPL